MRTLGIAAVISQAAWEWDIPHILLLVLALAAAIAFVVWVISTGVAVGMRSPTPTDTRNDYVPPSGFPVVQAESGDGPGRFRIAGVDRTSGADVTDHIAAESAANARVKAELRGIVVTKVERV
jgi:hypothetical protein